VAAVEARVEARVAADEEAVDEAVEEDFHSIVMTAQAAEAAILPAKMAGNRERLRNENVIFAEIQITRPILAIRPKTFELSSSLNDQDIKVKRNILT
jgi:hypothetical protein